MSFVIDRWLYPFEVRFFHRDDGLRQAYLDEGQGSPVVMVHGNPTWSVYYRDLVKALRGKHRCIVPDHIGMGLSDKPGDDAYRYTLKSRVDDLEALLDSLNLEEPVTLILHDWGGMIGMAWAHRHPERVKRLVIMNTAAFRLPLGAAFPQALALTRSSVGAFLARGLNAFAWGAALTCVTCKRLPADVRRMYVAPYNSWKNRVAVLRFVQDIPLEPHDPAYGIVSEVEGALTEQFSETPTLIFWGEKDFVFTTKFLDVWKQKLPGAEVVAFPDCGHYVLEDAREEIIPMVEDFLKGS